jgi:hypothetical protein
MLNGKKAAQTYIICELFRFDYKFAEWEDFNSAIVAEVSNFLDKCPPTATPKEIKGMLGHLDFKKAQ